MQIILLTILLIVTVAMIAIILIQRSDAGGLGSGNSNTNMTRGSADFLTHTTAILAGLFMVICIILAIMASRQKKDTILSQMADEKIVHAQKSQETDARDSPKIESQQKGK